MRWKPIDDLKKILVDNAVQDSVYTAFAMQLEQMFSVDFSFCI
jgi:hypothetical protein